MKFLEGFEELEPFLIGNPKQFLVNQGETYCVRECDSECPYYKNGCEFEEERIQNNPIPHPRRAIGFEENQFLVLVFREGVSFENFPRELWLNPLADKCLYDANLHFILNDPKNLFQVLKGQIRFYGTKEEFEESEYSKYFVVYDEYIPQQKIYSLDYSAIEPRFSAISSFEPIWLDVFKGNPKSVVREVNFTNLVPSQKYIEIINDKWYCFLQGELDKNDFSEQCSKCEIKDNCIIKKDIFKNIPDDWHSKNAEGFFGSEFIEATDKYVRKEKRDVSKRCGLALTYGAEAWKLSQYMNLSVDETQDKIDNFFRKLKTLQFYMNSVKRKVLETGKVVNLFGRVRDVSKWAFSESPDPKQRLKDAGYAQRTALNHPIQSSCAEILKIAMIRVDEWIDKSDLNPFSGISIPRNLNVSYRDFKAGILNSVHDELDYLIHDENFERLICDIYSIMQIKHVIDSYNCGFDLELDVEYDNYRSWTSKEAFPPSKIFFLNYEDSEDKENNAFFFQFSDCNLSILDLINSHKEEDGRFHLTFLTDDEIFIYQQSKFSEEFLRSIGLEYKIGSI